MNGPLLYFFFFSLSLLTAIGCASEAAPSAGNTSNPANKDQAVGASPTSLQRAIDFHGALVRVDSLRFAKHTLLYLADGSIDRESRVEITLYPQQFASRTRDLSTGAVTWFDPDTVYSDPSRAYDPRHRLGPRASFFTATLPWRLLDEAAHLQAGADTSLWNTPVSQLHASYPGDLHDEPWVHYFTKATGRHLGYFVDHGGNNALVRNVRDTVYQGLVLPAERMTYRVVAGEERWVRGRFFYRYF